MMPMDTLCYGLLCYGIIVCVMIKELDEEAKRILEELDQRKLTEGGKKAGIGKFTHASLEKNKKLEMFQTGE